MFARYVLLCLCLAASQVTASQVTAAEEGLLGYWKFDDGQGDVAVDSSGHQHDGDIWNAQWVEGPFGTALHFKGKDTYVAVPELAQLDGSDAMTVEAWVYWEGTGRYPNILTGGTWSPGGFLLFVNERQCSFRMGRPGVSAAEDRAQWREVSVPLLTRFEMRRWYHLAATFQRPTITTYVDGRQVGSSQWDYPVSHKNDLVIGKWSGVNTHHGLIDEVKVYERALSGAEILSAYQKQAAARSTADGQVAYELIPPSLQLDTAVAVFENDHAKLAINQRGRCIALLDKQIGENHMLRSTPLVSVKQEDRRNARCRCRLQNNRLVFDFADPDLTVSVRVESKPDYFVFHVDSVEGAGVTELTFLQLNLKECDDVSPMSGLAADKQFAVCLRALNLETRVQVGSHPPRMSATAFREHGLNRGKAALAACPTARIRRVLQKVVCDENLPYSALGGPFALDATENRGSYVFATVSEENVDRWIELARRGGISHVHLSGWQTSLGHYAPRAALFPNGLEGMKSVVDKLHAAGLKVGIHTLTGCISPHDPWVHPAADRRLATDGAFTLTTALDENDTTVSTSEPPGDFSTVWAYSSRGNVLRIGNELIQYSSISNEPPYGFGNCRRGAFGTEVASHGAGAPVQHVIARYGCFIPDEHSTLVDDVADAIAHVYNTCGLDMIYMDGAEAMRGWYGIARMRHAIYTRLRRPALVEASCWDHHSWPFHSRVGAWDHPKWGLKRFADDHFRAVREYRDACLLEPQLGWWVILGPDRDWDMETPDEMEYLCAKALGYDTPLSFQNVSVSSAPANARQTEYFTMIGNYERLRRADYFSETVKQSLREERQEFRLTQDNNGQWQFIPTDYIQHKVTGLDNGTSTWVVTNRYRDQPARLRLHALYSATPYSDPENKQIVDFAPDEVFTPDAAAPGVTCKLQPATLPSKTGAPGGLITGANQNATPFGAWGRFVTQFDPVLDLTPYDAIGLWVHGDRKGELINLQLTNSPEYFRTIDDHYIKVDFQGWRYFELLMRERDAASYHDYKWPYGAHCVLHRSPLVRPVVNQLTVYLNNLPAGEDVVCQLSPIKALRTRKVVLRNPAIEVNGHQVLFPVDLESGMYLEFNSRNDCRLYDERGLLLQRVIPQGKLPMLAEAENQLGFTCDGPEGFRTRAEITVMPSGEPLRGRRPDDQVDWSLLSCEYDAPRTILALDGVQNRWETCCRAGVSYADVALEVKVDQIGDLMSAYQAPTAMTLESFELSDLPANGSESAATFAFDSHSRQTGCSQGVTQQLTRSSETARVGDTSGCYRAISTLPDNSGWSYTSKSYQEPLDLSKFTAVGFWLYGDSKGQLFKLQLRDAEGGWQDHYTRVDFDGWKYISFQLGGPNLKDRSRITALNMYFNGIPAGKSVACFVDEIRALHPLPPLHDPMVTIAGHSIRFPVRLAAGDRLVFSGLKDCHVLRQSGAVEAVIPDGAAPKLHPGRNQIEFSLSESHSNNFRISVAVEKRYP